MTRKEIVAALLADPDKLLSKKPFFRELDVRTPSMTSDVEVGQKLRVKLPSIRYTVVDQSQYLKELDPYSHSVLFDANIPSVCVKTQNNGYQEIKEVRMALPYQETIRDKHVLHLCANSMQHTLLDSEPTDVVAKDFDTIKKYWQLRNMEGLKTQMVSAQKSVGDAGMLFYLDHKNEIHARILQYPEYTIITHKDDNGDHCLECVYYSDGEHEYVDCYDDNYFYRLTTDDSQGVHDSQTGWSYLPPVKHGFSEIPLVTKRGSVAWDKVQTLIEMFETLYNIFYVIQKRHGWGILYVKGKFTDTAKKIAGSVILNDKSMNDKSDAKFLSAPTPAGTIQTLEKMFDEIQIGGGATILLPKDIKASGDISGIAIQMTQSRDIETALDGVTEWQNVANKMMRLFKEGLGREFVLKGEDQTALTRFVKMPICSKFRIWKPFSESEYNQMLGTLKGAGLLSTKTGIELNTVSAPDELKRVNQEAEERFQTTLIQQEQTKEMEAKYATQNTTTTTSSTSKNE